MLRRTFQAGVLALVTSVAGCTGLQSDGQRGDGPQGEDDQREDDQREPDGADEPDSQDRVDPVYVQNLRDETATVSVTVTREGSGAVVFSATYELPSMRGVEIQSVGRLGRSYRVESRYRETNDVTTWAPATCERTGVEPTESTERTPLAVTVYQPEDDRPPLSVAVGDCDVSATESGVEYETHPAFLADSE